MQQQSSGLQTLVRTYMKCLEQHPLLTKALTSAVIAGAGDVLAQVVAQKGTISIKWRSVAAFSSFGLVVTGPITHCLYQLLETAVAGRSHTSSLKKVLLDRLLFAPPYLLALLYIVALLEGKSHKEAVEKIKLLFVGVLLKNWVIWGTFQYFNLSYVPLKYRVLCANLMALVWNTYLAYLRSGASEN